MYGNYLKSIDAIWRQSIMNHIWLHYGSPVVKLAKIHKLIDQVLIKVTP